MEIVGCQERQSVLSRVIGVSASKPENCTLRFEALTLQERPVYLRNTESRIGRECEISLPPYSAWTSRSSIWPGLACSPHLSVVTLIGAAAARSAYLPYGVAVIYRSRPEVSDQGEANAPGNGEDGAISDWCAYQQPPQRVNDGREGLVLGEPAHPS